MLDHQRLHSANFAPESGSQERPSPQSSGRVAAVEAMGSRPRDRSRQSSQDSSELRQWGAASGTFGSMTADLLRQLQTANHAAAMEEVTPATLARLRAALAASVSLDALQPLAPGVDRSPLEEYFPPLNAAMLQHNITRDTRTPAFHAQLGHESDGFNTLEEYASGSDYEGRTDLGNISPSHRERFKGRSPIQITGRYTSGECSDKLNVDLIGDLPIDLFSVSIGPAPPPPHEPA